MEEERGVQRKCKCEKEGGGGELKEWGERSEVEVCAKR